MLNTETVLLIVEDNGAVRALAAAALGEKHFSILQACDAAEALKLIGPHGRIDFLLTDVDLGAGPNGIELASRVVTEHPGVRVLLMSGLGESEDAAAREGFPFLAKPFTPASLSQRVEEVLATPAEIRLAARSAQAS